jgi:hypothetical protein
MAETVLHLVDALLDGSVAKVEASMVYNTVRVEVSSAVEADAARDMRRAKVTGVGARSRE